MDSIINNTKNFSFLGVTSQQQFADFVAWEIFFQTHRIQTFIELGSGHGGLSLYFLMMAVQRSFRFETYDIVEPKVIQTRLGKRFKLDKHFYNLDIFKDELMVTSGFKGITMLYCDNGNKPKEVKVFGNYLRTGDFLAVHDWDNEIKAADIPGYFVPIMHPICEQLECLTRFYEVIR